MRQLRYIFTSTRCHLARFLESLNACPSSFTRFIAFVVIADVGQVGSIRLVGMHL